MGVVYAFDNADLEDGLEIWCVPLPRMNVSTGKHILLKRHFMVLDRQQGSGVWALISIFYLWDLLDW